MKKVGGSLLVLNLILSLVAFCFVINLGVVGGKGGEIAGKQIPEGYTKLENSDNIYFNKDAPSDKQYFNSALGIYGSAQSIIALLSEKGTKAAALAATTSSASSIPTPFYKNIYGFGEAAEAQAAGKVTSVAAKEMIFAQGDFIDGLVSSFAWAGTVAGAVKMVGSFLGLEKVIID